MDLSMRQAAETFPYRHKKFDNRKRSHDEDTAQELEHAITAGSSSGSAFVLNPLFYGGERVSTPLSTDSNCSTDYAGFVALFSASSTPSSKRRRLLSGGQYAASPSEDSGISLTPKKQPSTPQQLPIQLKRSLKPSSLAEPPAKQQKLAPQQPVAVLPAKLINTALKRRKFASSTSSTNHINIPNARITNSATAAPNSGPKVNITSIKAALKPTLVGTLELTTATSDANTTSRQPVPAASATVLSRISEDKLRSICTYHGNMVRQFPKKERSPKDQERRNKNTIACRMSRRIKKLEQIAVEEQCKEFERQHLGMFEEMLRGNALLEQLLQLEQLTGVLSGNSGSEEEPEIDVVSVDDECCSPVASDLLRKCNGSTGVVPTQQPITVVPPAPTVPTIASAFSIAYLMGNSRNAK